MEWTVCAIHRLLIYLPLYETYVCIFLMHEVLFSLSYIGLFNDATFRIKEKSDDLSVHLGMDSIIAVVTFLFNIITNLDFRSRCGSHRSPLYFSRSFFKYRGATKPKSTVVQARPPSKTTLYRGAT